MIQQAEAVNPLQLKVLGLPTTGAIALQNRRSHEGNYLKKDR